MITREYKECYSLTDFIKLKYAEFDDIIRDYNEELIGREEAFKRLTKLANNRKNKFE